MHPPTEQMIRDYLNRVSVAARGKLGFSQRQSLLDRTRARIEAECGGTNGASAIQVRKALADLGDPIVLVELEAQQAGSKTSAAGQWYEPSIAGNGNREMAAERAQANNVAKGSEIGEDLLVPGGPNGSKPGRGGGSIRSLLAGLAATPRRRRGSAASEPAAAPGTRPGGTSGASGASGAPGAGSGRSGAGPREPSLIPSPRRPAASEKIGSPGTPGSQGTHGSSGTPGSPGTPAASKPRVTASAGGAGLARFFRGVGGAARNHTLEVLAIVLLGVGGALYPPIWVVGAALALPSKQWDIRDKFFGVTLPVLLLIVGTVLIIVFGGEHATIGDYAYEAWLGAGRLSRVLAAAGALYLAWTLRRGRRQPKQPPWNVPHRLG